MGADPPVVLVVEDDESARRLVRLGLELDGVVVVEAESLGRARQFLHPRIAGVVLDRELPDGDGLELLGEIGAACPHATVVVHSTLDDGCQPAWAPRVDKGDLPGILAALALEVAPVHQERLAVVDLVRSEADAVVREWEELCRWDPLLPPDSIPLGARVLVDAVAEALERPQPLGWGPDPALDKAVEHFASTTGAIDVAIAQLICLREAFSRHIAGHLPPAEEAESRARLAMIVDRSIWSAARVAAARLQRQVSLDPSTGLGDLQSFEKEVDREIRRAKRYGRNLTIVVLGPPALERGDLDESGEAELRRLAAVLATNIRVQDTIFRIGPATLGIVLPETGLSDGVDLTGRLTSGLGPGVTAGLATLGPDGTDLVALLHASERRRREGAESNPSPI